MKKLVLLSLSFLTSLTLMTSCGERNATDNATENATIEATADVTVDATENATTKTVDTTTVK